MPQGGGWEDPGDSDTEKKVRFPTMCHLLDVKILCIPQGPCPFLLQILMSEFSGSIMLCQNPHGCPSSPPWGITLTGALLSFMWLKLQFLTGFECFEMYLYGSIMK